MFLTVSPNIRIPFTKKKINANRRYRGSVRGTYEGSILNIIENLLLKLRQFIFKRFRPPFHTFVAPLVEDLTRHVCFHISHFRVLLALPVAISENATFVYLLVLFVIPATKSAICVDE